MAITDKEQGVWDVDQVYNKINQGDIWSYDGGFGGLWSWGRGYVGMTGHNDQVERSSPTQIPGTNWVPSASNGVSSTETRMYAHKTDGTLWAWGENNYGQLGQNNMTNYSSPVQIGTETTYSKIFTGTNGATAAIKTDGTLWTWGINNNGQLGHNEVIPMGSAHTSSPKQVGTNTTWKQVAFGYLVMYATKTDGTLWSWGANNVQLGQGNFTKRSSPTQIGTDTDWSNVGAGMYQGYATKTDGTLYSWGHNDDGSLGLNQAPANLGTTGDPTQVPGTTWSKVTGYRKGAFGLKTDNTLWVWGSQGTGDRKGILGLNQPAPTKFSSPVQIPGSWASVSASYFGTAFATKTDGTAWSWGQNGNGQQGHNDTVSRSSPTQIPGTWSETNESAGTRAGLLTKIN